jgi:predicted GH43/DUF377 family glycosyl hydrolase
MGVLFCGKLSDMAEKPSEHSMLVKKHGAKISLAVRFCDPKNKNWSAFNPSIASSPDGLGMMVRSSNYILEKIQSYNMLTEGSEIRNKLYFTELDENLRPTKLRQVKVVGADMAFRRGVEDARLFWRDGGWQALAVTLERAHTPVARLALFKFDAETDTATFVEKYDAGLDPKNIEKNWGVVSGDAVQEFDFIYDAFHIYKNGKLHKTKVAPTKKQKTYLESLRGGSQLLPYGSGYIGLSHITRRTPTHMLNPTTFTYFNPALRDYSHLFVTYDHNGAVTAYSEEFDLNLSLVEFGAGMAQVDDKFVLSFGVNDISGWLVEIPIKSVKEMKWESVSVKE